MKSLISHLLVIGCILLGLSSHAWAQNLSYGQTQAGTISEPAQTNKYTFSANGGDVVDFTLVTTSGSLVPKIVLYNPNGTQNSSNFSGAPYGCSGSTVEMNTVQLAATGVYTVLVGDCSDTNTGEYAIYMQSTNNPSGAVSLPFGQTEAGTIGSAAQSNTYTFTGNANDEVDFTLDATSGSLVPKIRLYNPDGTLNTSNFSGAPYGCSGSTVEMNTVTLPVSGTYIVLAGDCADTNTGNYEIYSQRTDSPAGNGLLFGRTQTGTISSAAQSNTYTFSANANDVVDFTLVTTSSNLVPKIRLYNSDGTLNSSNFSGAPYGCSGSTVEMNTVQIPATPATGVYTVLVGDCADTNTGTYAIYSQRTNNPAGAANLPFAQVQTGLIGSAAQSTSYTFSGNANDVVDFTLVTTNGGLLVPKIRLYNPAGTLNSSNFSGAPYGCSGSAVEMNTVTLPASGVYTVLVGDCSDTNTGNFAIYAQSTRNPSGPIPMLWGQVQPGTIASTAQSNTYTFVGSANNVVDFTMVTISGSGSLVPKIRLYNPDGSLNSSNFSGAPYGCSGSTVEMNSVKLTQPGAYTVLVGDCGDTNTGNYNLSSQCIGTCPVTPGVTISPTSLSFSNQPVGTTSTASAVTVTDNSTASVTFTSIAATGDFAIAASGTTCSISTPLAASSSCVINVTFTPTATGSRSGSLTLADNAPGSPQVADLSGTGTASTSIVSLNPTSVSFSNQRVGTTSAASAMTVTNNGTAFLTFTSIAVTGDFAIASGTTCTTSAPVPGSSNCVINVTFTPTATGSRSGSLTLTYNAVGSPQTVSLSGTGTTSPVATTTTLVVTPTTAAFGSLFTLTASVQDQNGKPVTNGSVTFYDGTTALGTVQVVTTISGGGTIGMATLKTILVPLGANSLTAKYVGADVASTSPAVVAAVTGTYPTTTTFASSGIAGDYTFTGTVAGAGPISPTGNVVFTDNTSALVVGTAALDPATWAQAFVYAPTISGFSNPVVVALVDINGDGRPDLFMGDSNGLTVALGNGDGTFQAPSLILSGATAELGLAFGDFNGDGKLDLAVATGGGITVLLGNGNGTFQTKGSYDNGNLRDIVVRDFNGDGILDILALNITTSTVDLLLGDGDGTLQAPVSYAVSSPLSLAVGDLNSDGMLDVVVGTAPNNVSIFLGNANGTLQTGETYVTQYEPGNLLLADFRGIGKLDLVTVFNQCCEGTDTAVNLMLGNGNGTFQPEQTILSGTNYSGLAVGDFNGDGKLDLVVSDYGYPANNVLLGNGDGTFQSAISYSAGVGPITPAVADLNHDGRPDIVGPNFNDGTATILLNQVTQTATLSNAVVHGTGNQSVTGAYAGDTNFATSTSNALQLAPSPAEPIVSLSPASLTFGPHPVGTPSASQAVTLTNTGNAPLSVSSIVASGDFAQSNNCGSSLAASGSCTISVTFTPTAAGAASGSLSFTDNAPNSPQKVELSGTGQDFTLAVASGSSSSASVQPGQTATYTLSLTGEDGFNQSVSFSCAGAPSEATCTAAPSPVTAGSSATSVTVTVTTTAPSVIAPRTRHLPPVPPLSPGLRGLLMLALLLAVIAWAMGSWNQPGVSRWRSTMVLLAGGLLLTLALAGCGGGGSSPTQTNSGTPPGHYTLMVTGTSGSGSSALSHSVAPTLTVT
ncbi:MAG: beta strand repeat-containing protein [Terriglobia bacterium]